MNKKINKKGFTLIELIVVIAILAVLGLLLVPQISGYINSAKASVGTANAKACYSNKTAIDAIAETGGKVDIEIAELKGCTKVNDDEYTYTDGTDVWTFKPSTGKVTGPGIK